MSRTVAFGLLLTWLASWSTAKDDRIIGGQAAQPRQFPYQASLRYLPEKKRHWCGASVLNDRWLLTAAHCVRGKPPSKFNVVVGTVSLNNVDGDTYALERIVVHETFVELDRLPLNDLALLKTTKKIQFSERVSPIPLAKADPQPGTELQLSGWGYKSYPELLSPNVLQYISLRKISLRECTRRVMPRFVWKHNICTLNVAGEGACRGDSGGPLVHAGRLVGVVSWGLPCARGAPDIYTRVASYINWIRLHLSVGNSA